MLHTHTDEGHMWWTCPKCKKENTAHVSHPQVEHPVHEDTELVSSKSKIDANGVTHTQTATRKGETTVHTGVIALPPCECGTRTFLKASFTEEEMQGVNLQEPVRDWEGNPTHDLAGNITTIKTPSYHAARRHMALAKQMKELGKDKPQTSPPGAP